MTKITSFVLGASLIFGASSCFAVSSTSLTTHWTCTTNASSSSVAADIASDKEMSEKARSSSDAFAFAAKNCRDCTKITCEASSND